MNEKISMYSPPFPRLKSYIDVIDLACEYGVKSVEPFCMFEFDTPDIEKAYKVKEYADKKGVIFSCFSVYANIVDADINEQIKRLQGFSDVAAVLGSPYLHHTIVGETRNHEKVISVKDELMCQGIELVREVFDYAKEKDVQTVYEDQGFIFNGVDGFGEFLSKVDRNVGVVADFGNVYQSGDSIEAFINAFHEKVVHAHIKDVIVSNDENSGLPALDGRFVNYNVEIGKGDLDCKKIIDLLKSYGYDGYYGIEYAVTDDNSPVIEKTFRQVDEWMR